MTTVAIAYGELVEIDLGIPLMDLGAIFAVTHPPRRAPAKTRAWIDFPIETMPPLAAAW